jgi:hypothetical protein
MLKASTALIVTAVVAVPSIFLFGAVIGTGSSGRAIAKECREHSSFRHVEHDSEHDSEIIFSCQEIKSPLARL